ncbi:DUF4856 domain-containing protein [Thalassotalea agarivorans]|uniref:Cadherin domain-containing protein n=1 Tax=Thalassotalea agarivorans TaxID=349064 RepID=A0A1I0B2E9_THASX|nr:DUF4856 domain-containing protein [Thalassotalea agarivorans]SET00889.1 protein of unknown function [Thalassotalea agarivorans]
MTFKKTLISSAIIASTALLSACGSSSSDPETTPPPSNSAPTDITLSSNTVAENAMAATIGTLSATDSDAGDTFTFTTADERFVISGDELALAESVVFDFEVDQSVDVTVQVEDSAGNTFSKALTIEITDELDFYGFASKFVDGESSVSYSGQIARHALIAELNHFIGEQLQSEIDAGNIASRQDVLDRLDRLFRTTEEQWDNFPITFTTGTKQTFFTDIASYKSLVGKIAGNDATGQHKDWTVAGTMTGWDSDTTPEGLVDILFGQLADNAEQYILGNQRLDADGAIITKLYLNADGTDLKQLIQKFLLGAVAYSQAMDDYFGDETEGKGLTTDNVSAVDGKSYSNLEHQFDEGYGYFGAARNYLSYNDNELAGKVESEEDGRADWNGKHDTDGDGVIDLLSEYNWGNSTNAAKRDRGTVGNTNPTNYTQDIMEALLAGRSLINENAGMALSAEQMEELVGYRDAVSKGWERAIATTVVHYINDTIADLENLGTDDFNLEDTAKHFSEMKGFALGLQFNPYSEISDADFDEIHRLMDVSPDLDTTTVATYIEDLKTARTMIATSLSLDEENVLNW